MGNWIGTWRNQYGSVVEIIDDRDNRIEGSFRTALPDSGFAGQTIPVTGVHQGDCVAFVAGGSTPSGDGVVSYTGLLRDGKMETMWFVVADANADREKLPWWRAVSTNADTFERIG